jgi:hypothetical protein
MGSKDHHFTQPKGFHIKEDRNQEFKLHSTHYLQTSEVKGYLMLVH